MNDTKRLALQSYSVDTNQHVTTTQVGYMDNDDLGPPTIHVSSYKESSFLGTGFVYSLSFLNILRQGVILFYTYTTTCYSPH